MTIPRFPVLCWGDECGCPAVTSGGVDIEVLLLRESTLVVPVRAEVAAWGMGECAGELEDMRM